MLSCCAYYAPTRNIADSPYVGPHRPLLASSRGHLADDGRRRPVRSGAHRPPRGAEREPGRLRRGHGPGLDGRIADHHDALGLERPGQRRRRLPQAEALLERPQRDRHRGHDRPRHSACLQFRRPGDHGPRSRRREARRSCDDLSRPLAGGYRVPPVLPGDPHQRRPPAGRDLGDGDPPHDHGCDRSRVRPRFPHARRERRGWRSRCRCPRRRRRELVHGPADRPVSQAPKRRANARSAIRSRPAGSCASTPRSP